jgi:[ribosomal protein S5]-alanine N-acetyltransferase
MSGASGRSCTFLIGLVKGEKVTEAEATPRGQRPLPRLELVRDSHAEALLAFELENRAYFAASIPDRGEEYFTDFDARHSELLALQAAGIAYFHLLLSEDGEVVGRVNLTEVADGSAELGYRMAEKVAGQGVATAAVRQLRELAAARYGLTRLRARATLDNVASCAVLERNGFVPTGELTLNGKPARSYLCELG